MLCQLSAITDEEKMSRAFSLSLAALIGEGIFNFGELVSFNCIVTSSLAYFSAVQCSVICHCIV